MRVWVWGVRVQDLDLSVRGLGCGVQTCLQRDFAESHVVVRLAEAERIGHVRVYKNIYMYIYKNMYVYTHTHIYVYIHMYIYV